jgi:hypothetical protein
MWLQGSEITAGWSRFALSSRRRATSRSAVVLLAVRRRRAAWVGEMLRSAHFMHPRSMTEVMMLGILARS